MATSIRTRSATEVNPAVARRPVAVNDHPLGNSPASKDSFTHVYEPERPKGPPVSTVNSEDEGGEEKEDGMSDRDELSDRGDEGSSYGGGSEFGNPTLADLIELDEPKCRVPTRITSSDGSKVACICGFSVTECRRHSAHRIKGRYRYPMAFYVRMTDLIRGFTGHGQVGASYTHAQIQTMRREDLDEMEHLTVGLDDETSDEDMFPGDQEPDPPRVSFGPDSTLDPNACAAPRTPTTTRIRDELVVTTRPGFDKQTKPLLWYGLIDVAGARWLFDSLEKAQEYVDTKVFRFARVFESKREGLTWKEGGSSTPLEVTEDLSNPDDLPSSSDDDSSVSSFDERRKRRDVKKAQSSKRKEKRRKEKRKGRKKAPSPPSSSSEDPSSSSSDSSSSDSDTRRSKRRRNKKKKKARGKKGKNRNQEIFTGSDPSVGDKKRIFGLPINGREIDATAGPPNMRDKDATELYCTAVDVTSLPGMFGSIGNGADELYDEAQRTTEMAATLLSTAIGRKAQIHDSLWKTAKRHSMGTIKSVETLFKFVKGVGKAEKPAFEQQENAIQVFMLSRHYDDSTISEYCQSGFLPRLTQASFRHYNSMLSMVRQLAYDHPAFWDQGPAKAMLNFHSERLLQIRQNSLTRKALVLQTYCYLRDANSKGFYHESMTESLWDRLASMTKSQGGGNGKGGGGGDGGGGGKGAGNGGDRVTRCSHCRSAKLHELAKVRPTKQLCPLKELSQKKAKIVAKSAVEKWEKSPSEGGFLASLAAVIADNKGDEE